MGLIHSGWVYFKDSKNILHEILDWRAKEGRARQHSRFGQLRTDSTCVGPNWLCCLARPSLAPQSRISCKAFLESLNHTHSSCIHRSHLYSIVPQHTVFWIYFMIRKIGKVAGLQSIFYITLLNCWCLLSAFSACIRSQTQGGQSTENFARTT